MKKDLIRADADGYGEKIKKESPNEGTETKIKAML